jgi:two-component system, chemotaxis family, chemotaxis protein CheY
MNSNALGPMKKQVLDVGQCQMDHGALRRLIEGKFAAYVTQAHSAEQALAQLHSRQFDLVLVNRKLDADYSDGLEIIKQLKADPELSCVNVMLVTNYAEHQEQAVAAGAAPGFGKAELMQPSTLERLKPFLA